MITIAGFIIASVARLFQKKEPPKPVNQQEENEWWDSIA